MKLPSQILCLIVAGATLVLAGCSKKPVRPDPSATLGPTGSGSSALSMSDVATTMPTNELQARDPGFDPTTGQNRAALAEQTVYFDFDSSSIKPSERTKLQAAKDYLDKNPGYKLLIEGRADWRGTAEYNLALGDRRANAVKQYLQKLGLPVDRIETLSKGSLEASKNADDATMAKDRRADLVVVQAPGAGAPVDLATPGATPAPAPAVGGAL